MHIDAVLTAQQRHAPMLPVDAQLDEALKIMSEKETTAILIMKNDHLSGILTRGDLLRRFTRLPGAQTAQKTIKEIMTSNPICASPQESAPAAIARMHADDISHLPVIEDGRVKGLLSITDLLFAQIGQLREEITHLQEYIETLQNAETD